MLTYDNENNTANPDTDIIIPEIEVPNFYATIRTDNETVLGFVGKDYEVVQNVEHFRFLILLWVAMVFKAVNISNPVWHTFPGSGNH